MPGVPNTSTRTTRVREKATSFVTTIEGLLNGNEQAVYPDLGRGGLNFKQAKKESLEQQGDLF